MQSPSISFRDNLKEVGVLMAMHKALGGPGPGRKHNVEVLNKSAILFACASFEAFIEELAKSSFDHIVSESPTHNALPKTILRLIAEDLKNDKHDLKIWDLAGNGWQSVTQQYRTKIIGKFVGTFNTPKPHSIEGLIKELIGFELKPNHWQWKGMASTASKEKLKKFVELRGGLAHGEKPANPVLKKDVVSYIRFLAPLSVRLSNEVRNYCLSVTGKEPWRIVKVGKIQ